MSLSYEDALSTLQSMFSDQGYTAQHLDAVLRHQGGHMENTVETLLVHGDGTPDELMRKLSRTPQGSALSGGGGGSVDADAELARQLAREDEGHSRGGGGGGGATRGSGRPARGGEAGATTTGMTTRRPDPPPAAGTRGRGTPIALPPDFLRIPGRKYPAASSSPPSSSSSSSSSSRAAAAATSDMTDEQLARMLQDELFQEELRNNPEFSHLAGRRNPRAHHPSWGAGAAGAGGQTTGRSNYGGAAGGGGDVGKDILEGLSKLGDTAKRRFQDLAANWNDPNRKSNQPSRPLFGGFGGGGGGGGTQGNAANGGNERRGLLSSDLNMDEEEEMNTVGRGSKKKD